MSKQKKEILKDFSYVQNIEKIKKNIIINKNRIFALPKEEKLF